MKRRSILGSLTAIIAAPALLHRPFGSAYAQDLGAVGDGRQNAIPILKGLLEQAEKRGKGTVQLPAGRFLLVPDGKATALTLPANVRLEGAGRDKTILAMANGAGTHVINAPYGYAQIADLTIDGNESGRPGAIGHNIRLESDECLVERVRSVNAVSYGIAIGQKRFARNIVIRDVEIVNAGADGLDVKNDLHRTEGIRIENLVVRGFGRPRADLPENKIGSESDDRTAKAGVDLRGTNCEVHGLTVFGVSRGRNGLRFRPGEKSSGHGPGAHGGFASRIVIKGAAGRPQGVGIRVGARGVRLEDVHVEGMHFGIAVGAEDLEIKRGQITRSADAAISATRVVNESLQTGQPTLIRCEEIAFAHERSFKFHHVESVLFVSCNFSDCTSDIKKSLSADGRVKMQNCTFDLSCGS